MAQILEVGGQRLDHALGPLPDTLELLAGGPVIEVRVSCSRPLHLALAALLRGQLTCPGKTTASLGRALVAVAGVATLAGPEREHELKNAIVDGLAPYRRSDGSYRLENEYHYLIASA